MPNWLSTPGIISMLARIISLLALLPAARQAEKDVFALPLKEILHWQNLAANQ